MKTIIKFLLVISLIFSAFSLNNTFAADNISGLSNSDTSLENVSIQINGKNSDVSEAINDIGLDILSKVKYIFSGVLLIFMVYSGAQMILSMGTNEDQLSSAKRNIRYTMVGLILINMPGTLYNALSGDNKNVSGGIGSSWSNEISSSSDNLFINIDTFGTALNDYIIKFIEVMMSSVAILIIIIAGIRIITSRGREDQVNESKKKIIWSVVGLIFVGMIEAWQSFIYSGNISDGTDIFETIANLALFLAGPIAIFFLTLAGYYYITSDGNEDRAKKGKTIIVNTLLATAILLCSFIFLNDLITIG